MGEIERSARLGLDHERLQAQRRRQLAHVRRSRDDAEAAKLKDFRIADRGEEVVAAWTFCTARRARAWHRLHIWGTSAVTEAEQVLWERSLTYPRGCRRRRVAFP